MPYNPETGEYIPDVGARPALTFGGSGSSFGFDPGQSTRDYLAAISNPDTLKALLGAEAAARPALGNLGLKDIGQYSEGVARFDVNAFLAARPDILNNFNNAKDDYTRMYGSLEQYAKAAADAENLTANFTVKEGGSIDLFKALGGAASGVETAANTAVRTASTADINALAPQLAATYNQLNPEVLASLKRAEALAAPGADPYAGMRSAVENARQFGDLSFTPAQASLLGAAPQVGLGGYNAAQTAAESYNAALAQSGGYQAERAAAENYNAALAKSQGYTAERANSQGYNAAQTTARGYTAETAGSQGYNTQGYTPDSYNAAQAATGMQTEAERLARGKLGESLYNQALQAGPSSAAQLLGGRAAQFAASTGQLSPEELRNIQQGTREAYAARGIEMSNPAIAAEAAARSGAMRQRQAEDLAQAVALNQAYTQDLTTNRNFGTGLYGQEIGLQQSNQQAALQAALANQQANQNVTLANVGATNTASQFNTGLKADASQFGANAANQASQFAANAANQVALANQLARNTSNQFGADASNQANALNQTATNTANQFSANAANQAALQNALLGTNAGQFGADAANQMFLANQLATNTANQFSANSRNQAALQNALLGSNAGQFGADAANQAFLANQLAMNTANQFGANARNQANTANQSATNAARVFEADARNQTQLTNAELMAKYAVANQGAANQFSLANQLAQMDVNAQNRTFSADQAQKNITNLGVLGQAGANRAVSDRDYAATLAQGYRNAAYDPMSALLGQTSNAAQTAGQQQNYVLDLAKMFNTPTTYNPDTGINLALANQANITNKQIADTSAAAQLAAAKAGASATKTSGIVGGIGSIVGGALAGKVLGAKAAFLCIPEGELIDTPEGQVAIEDIRSGDSVIGFSGEPVKVLIKHEYAENPEAERFHRFYLDNGKDFSVCDMHRIEGERSMDYNVGNSFKGGEVVEAIAVYGGVTRSYDLLTEDIGYRMSGVAVNSMIEELAAFSST
jgi:hypothetical protein